jgi:hypothetical protein
MTQYVHHAQEIQIIANRFSEFLDFYSVCLSIDVFALMFSLSFVGSFHNSMSFWAGISAPEMHLWVG